MVKVEEPPDRWRGSGDEWRVAVTNAQVDAKRRRSFAVAEEWMLGEGILDGNLTVADESLVDYGMRTKREREFG